MIINVPFFNELNSDSLKDYYEVDIDVEQNKVQIDVNFDETSIAYSDLLILKSYLDDLPVVIEIAKNGIFKDFNKGVDVKEFLNFHIDELDKNELDSLLKNADKSISIERQLLSVIKLRRIGFYLS
jgi:hypothetical protein